MWRFCSVNGSSPDATRQLARTAESLTDISQPRFAGLHTLHCTDVEPTGSFSFAHDDLRMLAVEEGNAQQHGEPWDDILDDYIKPHGINGQRSLSYVSGRVH